MYMFKKSLIVNENIKLPFNFFPINLYWQIVVSQACIKKIGYYYFCALRKLTFYKGYTKTNTRNGYDMGFHIYK